MSSPGKDILQVYGVLNFVYLFFIFLSTGLREILMLMHFIAFFFLMKSMFCLFFSSPFSYLVFFLLLLTDHSLTLQKNK